MFQPCPGSLAWSWGCGSHQRPGLSPQYCKKIKRAPGDLSHGMCFKRRPVSAGCWKNARFAQGHSGLLWSRKQAERIAGRCPVSALQAAASRPEAASMGPTSMGFYPIIFEGRVQCGNCRRSRSCRAPADGAVVLKEPHPGCCTWLSISLLLAE